MLTIAKLNAHSVAYYESTTADDGEAQEQGPVDADDPSSTERTDLTDYYSEHGDTRPVIQVSGRDHDAAARMAHDLQGVTDGQTLSASQVSAWIDSNIAPAGEIQGRRFGDASLRGYDLTYSAPKSVSLLGELSDDAEVRRVVHEAHERAIRTAQAYLGDHAGYTRQRMSPGAEPELVRVETFTSIRYDHRVSRPATADQDDPGDPHLHSHVLVPNRQWYRALDGQLMAGSLDGTSLYYESKAAGTVYQASLRATLTQALGVEWQRSENGLAEIKGFSPSAIQAWSRRARQIHVQAAQDAPEISTTSAATALGRAQKTTRNAKKQLGMSDEDLRDIWTADDARVATLPGAVTGDGVDLSVVQDRPIAALAEPTPTPDAVLAAVAAERSTWTRRHLVEQAASMWPAGSDPADVLAGVEALADQAMGQTWDVMQRGGREGSRWVTADAAVEAELEMLRTAGEIDAHLPVASVSDSALAGLSEAQGDAARTLLTSPDRAMALVAPAGAGKTTMMASARSAWEEDGRTVVGLAPSGRAADELVKDGAVSEGGTIAGLLKQARDTGKCPWDDRTVVVVDEAGMASNSDVSRILTMAQQSGAKVVLVGDPEQLASVRSAGGALDLLSTQLPDTTELHDVYRQHDPEEAAQTLALRNGDRRAVEAATRFYGDRGRLHIGSEASMENMAVQGWAADVRAARQSVMVASTRSQMDDLNRAAQQLETARGVVLPLTDEHGDPVSVALSDGSLIGAGDIIMTRQNSREILASDGAQVRNGQRWVVIGSSRDGVDVERADGAGATATLPREYLAEHAHLGYASTVHASQGSTVDTVHAVIAEGAPRDQLYVAMTRGRDANDIYMPAVGVSEITPAPGHQRAHVVPEWVGDQAMAEKAFIERVIGSHDKSAARSALRATMEGRLRGEDGVSERAMMWDQRRQNLRRSITEAHARAMDQAPGQDQDLGTTIGPDRTPSDSPVLAPPYVSQVRTVRSRQETTQAVVDRMADLDERWHGTVPGDDADVEDRRQFIADLESTGLADHAVSWGRAVLDHIGPKLDAEVAGRTGQYLDARQALADEQRQARTHQVALDRVRPSDDRGRTRATDLRNQHAERADIRRDQIADGVLTTEETPALAHVRTPAQRRLTRASHQIHEVNRRNHMRDRSQGHDGPSMGM